MDNRRDNSIEKRIWRGWIGREPGKTIREYLDEGEGFGYENAGITFFKEKARIVRFDETPRFGFGTPTTLRMYQPQDNWVPRWDFRIYTPEELMPSGLTQKEQEFIKECLREKGWLW